MYHYCTSYSMHTTAVDCGALLDVILGDEMAVVKHEGVSAVHCVVQQCVPRCDDAGGVVFVDSAAARYCSSCYYFLLLLLLLFAHQGVL